MTIDRFRYPAPHYTRVFARIIREHVGNAAITGASAISPDVRPPSPVASPDPVSPGAKGGRSSATFVRAIRKIPVVSKGPETFQPIRKLPTLEVVITNTQPITEPKSASAIIRKETTNRFAVADETRKSRTSKTLPRRSADRRAKTLRAATFGGGSSPSRADNEPCARKSDCSDRSLTFKTYS